MSTRIPTDDELDSACQRLFDFLETALALLVVPPEVQSEIARRFGARRAEMTGDRLAHLCVAVPKLDSGARTAAPGQRSAGAPTSARQLIYSTEGADFAISVREKPGGPRLDVNGQVFPSGEHDEVSYTAVLLRGGDEVAASSTDEFGEFSFEAMLPGDYYMLVCSDSADVTILPLQLGA